MIGLIKIILLSFIVVNIKIPYNIIKLIEFKTRWVELNSILNFILHQPFRCYKCFGFWSGLIVYDFWVGAGASLILYIMEKNDII